jgi:hypothetical protein
MSTTEVTMSTSSLTGAEILGRFSTYATAQHAVDFLSDAGFSVQHLSIVGDDLQSVEQVTSRLTVGRAAVLGAAEGAWMGTVLVVLLAIISPWAVLSLLVTVPVAVAGGAVFGAAVHTGSRGMRDFTSTRQIVAGSYAVLVAKQYASDARSLLGPE